MPQVLASASAFASKTALPALLLPETLCDWHVPMLVIVHVMQWLSRLTAGGRNERCARNVRVRAPHRATSRLALHVVSSRSQCDE